jgi:AbrB family looped-hinge helix DNA binding protein
MLLLSRNAFQRGNAMEQAKVTYKGQITLPKAVREALNIEQGDSVMLRVEGDHAILRPIKKKALLELYGAFPATQPYPGAASLRKKVGRKLGENLCAGVKS